MRHLVGSSLLSGLAAGFLIGCSLSTVGAMDPAEGEKCSVPMQTKTAKDGCTVCTCNGTTWDCQSGACAATCQPGDQKLADDGCNSCSCGTDGTWSCTTDQMCPSECQPGDTKLRDDGCATCTCDDSGSWACPDIACVKCAPGEKTMEGCQACVCNATGTGYTCSGDPNCGSATVCQPGDSMSVSCKTCVCDMTGSSWNCMASMDPSCNAAGCTPGQIMPSSDGCNTCTCQQDGSLACTEKACNNACPAPSTDQGMCPSEAVYAQNPMTKDCCAYKSKCEAPAGWNLYVTPDCSTTKPVTCASGTADCDGDPKNGCEIDVMTSPYDCGGCGIVCMSTPDQMPACDQGKCVAPPQSDCVYEGAVHTQGEMFKARDNCNSCACSTDKNSNVVVLCTDSADCKCNPGTEPYRNYVANDPMLCQTLDYMCPEYTTPFTNDCGCGCEQGTECPDVFDCTPDPMTGKPACDATATVRCPFSTVAK